MDSACYSCSRRLFINGFGAFAAVGLAGCATAHRRERPVVRFGIVTDCHYAKIPYAKRKYPVGDAAESCKSVVRTRECAGLGLLG